MQHEHFEGRSAKFFTDGDDIVVKANCREVGGRLTTPVRYGIWITFEVADQAGIDVYASVAARIQQRAQVRTHVR